MEGRSGEDNAATGGPLNREKWNLVAETANRAIFAGTTNHLDVRTLLFSVETHESGERIGGPGVEEALKVPRREVG